MLKDAIDVECRVGDVVLFNNILVHRGGVNSTDRIRWTFDWRFQDAAKSTFRDEHGHIVWAKSETRADVVNSPDAWAARAFG